jgi:carbamoyl-phosphate synthase large subunit
MKLFLSTVGRRGYIVDYFREAVPDAEIHGSSNSEWTSGFAACDKRVLMPSISEPGYPDALMGYLSDAGVNGLLSFYDLDVLALSRHRSRILALGVVPLIPGEPVADTCLDKWKTFQFLTEHGFATPPTFLAVEDALAAVANGGASFPMILKPRFGFASIGLYRCRNEQELRFFASYLASEFVIQEVIRGHEHSFDILNDLDGQTLSIVAKRKLQMRAGETDMSETVKTQALLDLGTRLSDALGNRGPLDVDFFLDEEGRAIILELNPRFGGGYPGSHVAGADFPRKIARLIRGERLTADIGNYREGVRMMKDIRIIQPELSPVAARASA